MEDEDNKAAEKGRHPRRVSGSLFRRLLKRFREHLSDKRKLEARIRQLEYNVAAEHRKAADLDRRLHRVVDGYASREPGPNEIVRLCVNVDRRQVNSSHGNAVFEEAARQLIESLRHELSR